MHLFEITPENVHQYVMYIGDKYGYDSPRYNSLANMEWGRLGIDADLVDHVQHFIYTRTELLHDDSLLRDAYARPASTVRDRDISRLQFKTDGLSSALRVISERLGPEIVTDIIKHNVPEHLSISDSEKFRAYMSAPNVSDLYFFAGDSSVRDKDIITDAYSYSLAEVQLSDEDGLTAYYAKRAIDEIQLRYPDAFQDSFLRSLEDLGESVNLEK